MITVGEVTREEMVWPAVQETVVGTVATEPPEAIVVGTVTTPPEETTLGMTWPAVQEEVVMYTEPVPDAPAAV